MGGGGGGDDGGVAFDIDRTTRTNRGGSNKGNGVSEEEDKEEEEAGLILKSVCSKRLGYCGNVTYHASHVKHELPVAASRLCKLQEHAALQRGKSRVWAAI